MTAATDKQVAEIHGLLASMFRQILTEGAVRLAKDGEVVKVTPDAAMIREIRNFLLDNDIKAVPKKGTPLGDLVEAAFPFSSDDEDGATGFQQLN
jgi:hypothetical protein